MKIITSDEDLRRFMPNTFATVKGENTFFEKMVPFLESAENWLIDNFVGSTEILDTIKENSDMHFSFSNIIVCHALMNAIPSLDLVLTPNGFGVVSNQNVAPASKDRVARLIDSLEKNRDNCIAHLLKFLPSYDCWHNSSPYRYFAKTLFPNLSYLDKFCIFEHKWEKYKELQPTFIHIEMSLAEEYFSEEQMNVWRYDIINNNYLLLEQQRVIDTVCSQIIKVFKGGSIMQKLMLDCVNIIRLHPESFPEWHKSSVAELFSPPRFTNKKKNNGYWF